MPVNSNTLTEQEKEELIERIQAYLELSDETKSALSTRLGYSECYISNFMSGKSRNISRQSKVLLEYRFKEFGEDLIDEYIKEKKENASSTETVSEDCEMSAINNIDKKLDEILDSIQNSRTLYISPVDSVEMIKISKKFGIRRDKMILYAMRYFYHSQLHNYERDGEYKLPRNCLEEVK